MLLKAFHLPIRTKFFFSTLTELKVTKMRYLNVAEKNDAAKNIAQILSKGASNRREGLSPYNKIYEFNATVFNEQARMIMTSVSGHLLNYEFTGVFKNWQACSPLALFDAPIIKLCPENYQKVKKTIEREIRSCHGLIIWTDCDREGENIGFEIIKVCSDIKPNLRIYRAKFSEITAPSIFRALRSLEQPNKNISDAVDVRQELDLRTGAAFTRLQTLRLQKIFPHKLSDKLISYGSCQFPTLGFVVERYQAIEDFIAEPFWRIKMSHTVGNLTADFFWKRDRLFDKHACQALLDICQENSLALVENVENKEKSKWRPLPLDTVEMEKNVSRKLKINAKDTMKLAERLYTQGYISYPRTETNIFPKELNLTNLIQEQVNDVRWGMFAQRIINNGGPSPRQGKKSDQAHPPIHPTKYAPSLQGNEQRLYEYIVRHFLACLYKDAKGFETIVTVSISKEKFQTKGLIILEKNYLDVYIYEKWNTKEINNYNTGNTFVPTLLDIVEGSTTPPKLLTEADLITLMEKYGIGTDATHAEHIDKIKSREYVGLHENMYFVPGTLGMGLVEGYNNIDLEVSLAKPILRSEFENDLKLICDGLKDPEEVRKEQTSKYKAVFQTVVQKMRLIDESLGNRLEERPAELSNAEEIVKRDELKPALKCPKCGNDMVLMYKKKGMGQYLSCTGSPECQHSIWFPTSVDTVEVQNSYCEQCGPNFKKLKFKFKHNLFPGEPNPNILCIGGCDINVLETLSISLVSVINQRGLVMNHNTTPNVRQNQDVRNNISKNNMTGYNLNTSRTNVDSKNISNKTKQNSATGNWNFNASASSPNLLPGPSNFKNNIMDNSVQLGEVVCSCNEEAIMLNVKKAGPNQGRNFYKCASGSCNFFLWASNLVGQTDDSYNRQHSENSNPIQIKCDCGQLAAIRKVTKTGANTGRQFYSCPKSIGQGCNFFKWVDEENDGNTIRNGENLKHKGKFEQKNKKNTTNHNNQTRAKRKCGICGEEGHNKLKCPNK